MTKRELQEYYWVRRNIDRLEDRLLELETEATKMTTTLKHDPRSDGYSKDKLAGVVAKIVNVQDEINEQLGESYRMMAEIERAAERLPQKERYLIRLRYLELKSWGAIGITIGCSPRQVHRIHSRALKLLNVVYVV